MTYICEKKIYIIYIYTMSAFACYYYRTMLVGITNILEASMDEPRDDDNTYQFYDDYSNEDEDYNITFEQAHIIEQKKAVSLCVNLTSAISIINTLK